MFILYLHTRHYEMEFLNKYLSTCFTLLNLNGTIKLSYYQQFHEISDIFSFAKLDVRSIDIYLNIMMKGLKLRYGIYIFR